MTKNTEITRLTPRGNMDILSQLEVSQLKEGSKEDGLYETFRRCSLAVLNVDSTTDDAREVLERYQDFQIRVVQQARGVKLEIENAPESAFVDGKVIRGIQEQLFSVLRDVSYVKNKIESNQIFDMDTSEGITNVVFHILRNARVLVREIEPNLVVCWGGHSIGRVEYDYCKDVGYQLGLRGLNICTGCGPGAMKAPMKGAAIGHNKQRIRRGRHVGLTEPGIIAAESPNPIVNELVILPDIEKRLEGFVRAGHGIIIFPGGVGTAEEILFILGILLNPENRHIPFPLILTGPESASDYFKQIDEFIKLALGREAQEHYTIIIDDATKVAREMTAGLESVRNFRREHSDAYYFNWLLNIDHQFQKPFHPSHENVAALNLGREQDLHLLAADLRRVFSAIVSGNVKADGIQRIEKNGPFVIRGEKQIMQSLDALLHSFVAQQRMKVPGKTYTPCYYLNKQ
ncbi:MAG: nucleotide 5'-monophosphate nucleosidase PpnN [Gammaproteobacteria bacterium]|nr:nucleotide 5'-monophosphate nucleosidase PpnN [Gammaproteobacteria bacterium]MDH3859745.1 nucleotide 5'-monophosphate nucleosidase PpnN [Gammaproteobacteria bacterium]